MLRTYLIISLLLLTYPMEGTAKQRIFACEAEWASLAQELAGDVVEIYQATTGKQDVHHIQARPSLLAQARQADLLICTGADLEIGWLPVLLSKTGNSKIQPGQLGHFMAADWVELKDQPTRLDRSEGDIHADGNPHIQTNPHNIAKVAVALNKRLQQLDSVNATHYQTRYTDFAKRWQTAIQNWEQRAVRLKNLPVVVYHDGWIYLQDWLLLKKVATLEPIPGIPPTSGHLAEILRILQTQPAKVVIYASYEDTKAAQWLSNKANIPVLELPISVGGADDATDLFSFFETLLTRLLTIQ